MTFGTWSGNQSNRLGWLPCAAAVLVVLCAAGGLWAFQRNRFQDLQEATDWRSPAGANDKTEWAFARLRYGGDFRGFRRGGRWATDYPKADRQFVQGVSRLTRLDVRPIEEVVEPATEELFDWPWLYAVEVGSWNFTPAEAQNMRDFFAKGGFLMVDDFHGSFEWETFQEGLRKVFPDRPIEDLRDDDPIFHVIADTSERIQVPNVGYINSHRTYERDGVIPQWRAIRDEQGRIVVAICHNMDLGDAWEWADNPYYPERFTSLAYRIGINYIMYGMTH